MTPPKKIQTFPGVCLPRDVFTLQAAGQGGDVQTGFKPRRSRAARTQVIVARSSAETHLSGWEYVGL